MSINQNLLQNNNNFKVKAVLKEHKNKEQFNIKTKFKIYYQLKSFKFVINPKAFYFHKRKWRFNSVLYLKKFKNFYFKRNGYRLSFFFKQLLKFYFRCNEHVFKQKIFNKILNFSNRFDIVCVRSMFCNDLSTARLYIKRGYFLINNKKINIWNYYLKKFDRVQLNKDCKFICLKKNKVSLKYTNFKVIFFDLYRFFRSLVLKFRFNSYNLQRIYTLFNSLYFCIYFNICFLINIISKNFDKNQNIKLFKKILYFDLLKNKQLINIKFSLYKIIKFINCFMVNKFLFFNFVEFFYFILKNIFYYIKLISKFKIYIIYCNFFNNTIKNKVFKTLFKGLRIPSFLNFFFFIYRYSRFYNLFLYLRIRCDELGFSSVIGAKKPNLRLIEDIYNFYYAHTYRMFSRYMFVTKLVRKRKMLFNLFIIQKNVNKFKNFNFIFYKDNFINFLYNKRIFLFRGNKFRRYTKFEKVKIKNLIRRFTTIVKISKKSNLLLLNNIFFFKNYLILDFFKLFKNSLKNNNILYLFIKLCDISLIFNFVKFNVLFNFIYSKQPLFIKIIKKHNYISGKIFLKSINYSDIIIFFIIKYICIKFNIFFKYLETKSINILQLVYILEYFFSKFFFYFNLNVKKYKNSINLKKINNSIFFKFSLSYKNSIKNYYIANLYNYKNNFFKFFILKKLYYNFFSCFNFKYIDFFNFRLIFCNFNVNGIKKSIKISKKIYNFYIKLFYDIFYSLILNCLRFKYIVFRKFLFIYLFLNNYFFSFNVYKFIKIKLFNFNVFIFLINFYFKNLFIFYKNLYYLNSCFILFFNFINKKNTNFKNSMKSTFRMVRVFLNENRKCSRNRNVPYFFFRKFYFKIFVSNINKIIYINKLNFKLDYLFKIFKRNFVRTKFNYNYWKNLKGFQLNYYFSRNFLYYDIALDINSKSFIYLGLSNTFVNDLLMQRNLFLILILRFYKKQRCLKKC